MRHGALEGAEFYYADAGDGFGGAECGSGFAEVGLCGHVELNNS